MWLVASPACFIYARILHTWHHLAACAVGRVLDSSWFLVLSSNVLDFITELSWGSVWILKISLGEENWAHFPNPFSLPILEFCKSQSRSCLMLCNMCYRTTSALKTFCFQMRHNKKKRNKGARGWMMKEEQRMQKEEIDICFFMHISSTFLCSPGLRRRSDSGPTWFL